MKIALLSSDRGPCPPIRGGAIQLLISRVAPLLAKTHEVTVFSITDPELPGSEISTGVGYERYPKEEFFDRVRASIKNQNFDVIQVYNRPSWVYGLREDSPDSVILLSMHNLMLETVKVSKEEAEASIGDADRILTVSRFVADDIRKKFPMSTKKLQVLHTGVDLKEYEPVWTKEGRRWREKIRSKYKIRKKAFVVLYVGRLVPYKGCHLLLQALEKMSKVKKNISVLVVGSKWYADVSGSTYIDKLHRLAKNVPGQVTFTSYVPVDDIPKYYAAADVFVCTSQWKEPLARVHYEAMAAGLPIITTRRGGNHEVVQHMTNGFVISKYDQPNEFAAAIQNLIEHPKLVSTMGRRGRERVEKTYNFERVADELVSIYQSLLKKRRRGRGE